MIKQIIISAFLVSSFAFTTFAATEVYEFETVEQENVFKKLGKELRCPKCQNNNIADSNSSLAQDLRTKVYEMLKQGKSEDDIVAYMVERYGNFVTYNPPITGSTLILWLGPLLFLAGGFVVLFKRSQRAKVIKEPARLAPDEKARLAALLDEDTSAETMNKDNKK